MKRIVSLALVFVLLLSTVTVFSACRKKNKNTIETTDWVNYLVVYNSESFTPLGDAVGDVFTRLEARIGEAPYREATGTGEGVETDEFEIIIGDTDRTATATAKSRIEGNGWCILPMGKKIVIYGTTGLLTVKALQTFMDTYLPAGGTDAAPVDLHEEIHSDVPMVTIESGYRLIYDANLDADPGYNYGDGSENSAPSNYDYPYAATLELQTTIAGACGCAEKEILLKDDKTKQKSNEIAVGITSRQISTDLLAELGNVDRYGVLIRDGAVAVGGFNDVTLRQAVTLFNACIQNGKQDNGTVLLPDDLLIAKTKTTGNWFTDFPLPSYSNLTLTASEDVGQNSVEYYYSGSGVTTENYEDYCAKLVAAGFELYTANTIEGSIYRTYVSEAKAAMLHVTYAAFAHANDNTGDNPKVTLYKKAIRIVSSPIGNKPQSQARLIEKDAFDSMPTFERITDTRITAMQMQRDIGNFGNAYIITLEDGSFIILDGGAGGGNVDHDRLYRVLRDLYRLAHGYASNETDHRIKLAAWYLSHSHGDHCGNFSKFAAKYGSKIDAERMLANLCSDSETYNSYNPNNSVRDQIANYTNVFGNSAETHMSYYKVRTGWKFYIRNIELEVLFTHEDLCPERLYYFNDSSTAIRMTIYNTDGQGNCNGTPTTVLWVGDMFQKGCQFMRASYGEYLHSDMGQVAHHGYQGCDWAFYKLMSPTVMWWPAAYEEAIKWSKPSYAENTRYGINGRVLYQLQSVEYYIFCDLQNITVTITADGPQMHLYDPDGDPESDANKTALYNADSINSNFPANVTSYGTYEVPAGIFRSATIRKEE